MRFAHIRSARELKPFSLPKKRRRFKKPVVVHKRVPTVKPENKHIKPKSIQVGKTKGVDIDKTMSYIVSGDSGAGHAIELGVALKKLMSIQSVWFNRSHYGFDFLDPTSKFGFANIPNGGNELIIVSANSYLNLLKNKGREFFKNWNKIKIILTDGTYTKNSVMLNQEFRNYIVFATPCKIVPRGKLPTLEYYQSFDFSKIEIVKNKFLSAGHSPFHPSRYNLKGTNQIIRTFKKYNLPYDLIVNDTWVRCIERKKKCHIFVDQIDCTDFTNIGDKTWRGGVGKSGWEAVKLKCLVISRGKFEGIEIPTPPIAWCDKFTFDNVLRYYIKNTEARNDLINKQYEWGTKYLDPNFTAKRVYYDFSEERKNL